MSGLHHAPAAFTPGKDPVPIVQKAGWAPEPVWICAENLAPPGFDHRVFQPVASRYTDYAIRAPMDILPFTNSLPQKYEIVLPWLLLNSSHLYQFVK
jgi:hypothetical protein